MNANHTRRETFWVVLLSTVFAASAAGAAQPAAVSDWSQVRRLEPTSEVRVGVRGVGLIAYRVAYADERELVVLRFASPSPPSRVLRALRSIAPDLPATFGLRKDVVFDSIRFSHDGLFDGAAKIADVIELAREDVVEIQVTSTHGSKAAAIAGVAVGGAIGVGTAVSLAFKRCGASCADEQARMFVSVIGFPLAGGLLGYHAGGRKTETMTIYRASDPAAFVLDQITWQRLRGALPLSWRAATR